MRESAIIYKSAYEAVLCIDEALQLKALKGLLEYGFYDIVPESEDPVLKIVFLQALPGMRCAKERYELAVENGKKGGRPAAVSIEDISRMRQEGLTNKAIAAECGCSERNIEKRFSLYGKNFALEGTNRNKGGTNLPLVRDSSPLVRDSSGFSESDRTNRTNLTVNDNDTDNEPGFSKNKNYQAQKVVNLVSGDGLPGRRIRDLSEKEADEIKFKLKADIPCRDIEREYAMRSGVITPKFAEHWEAFLFAKANGRIR